MAAGKVPQDISVQYAAGTAVVSAYQTSGVFVSGSSSGGAEKKPTAGQADSFSVMQTTQPLTPESMDALMDCLQEKVQDIDNGSTGALLGIAQGAPAAAGGAAFDIVNGSRGDSQGMIVKIDAAQNVQVTLLLDAVDQATYSVSDFGNMSLPGENNISRVRIELQAGDKAVVLAATDGMTDAYLNKPGRMQADIADYIKANPEAADLSRFLAERATALGTQDNTTIVSTVLTAETSLAGKGMVLAVFDGLGHEDGSLSSLLARALERQLPGGRMPPVLARRELAHVSRRADDLARVATPAQKDPHVQKFSQDLAARGGSQFVGLKTPAAKTPLQKPAAPGAKA
jgi:hypothetical protein